MRSWNFALFVLLSVGSAAGQDPHEAKVKHVSLYLDRPAVEYDSVIPAPPEPGSAAYEADRAEVLRAQKVRVPADIASAQRDDAEEDIFIFADVMGPEFRSEALPLTTALSKHLRNESGVVNPDLKLRYQRPRPFAHDDAVHPVCAQTLDASYPSGHAMVGYLEALALAQMVPEKSAAIIRRADQYAHNRVICGVHFPSDVEASRNIAYVLFGSLAATPRFQSELAAARNELRHQLVVQLAPIP